ncbi:hypothetical protein D3C73_745100 [compost metagenome]
MLRICVDNQDKGTNILFLINNEGIAPFIRKQVSIAIEPSRGLSIVCVINAFRNRIRNNVPMCIGLGQVLQLILQDESIRMA